MSTLTSNTVNTLVSANATQVSNTGAWNFTTVYFRITTAQGLPPVAMCTSRFIRCHDDRRAVRHDHLTG
jgi:hypothetical protein